jgi:hypothetical protein
LPDPLSLLCQSYKDRGQRVLNKDLRRQV